MFETPWLSTPRTSAVTSTSAPSFASLVSTPTASKIAWTTRRRLSGFTRMASSSWTRKISSIGVSSGRDVAQHDGDAFHRLPLVSHRFGVLLNVDLDEVGIEDLFPQAAQAQLGHALIGLSH